MRVSGLLGRRLGFRFWVAVKTLGVIGVIGWDGGVTD